MGSRVGSFRTADRFELGKSPQQIAVEDTAALQAMAAR
jgi:hypothetical protein